jgi:hypothetical protein
MKAIKKRATSTGIIWDYSVVNTGVYREPVPDKQMIIPEFLLGGWVFSGLYYRNPTNPVVLRYFVYLSPKFPEHALLLDDSEHYKIVCLAPTRPDQNSTLAWGKIDFMLIPE